MQPGSAQAAWLVQGTDLKNSWARQHPALPVHKDCCEACEGPSVPSPRCSRISARSVQEASQAAGDRGALLGLDQQQLGQGMALRGWSIRTAEAVSIVGMGAGLR